VGVGRLGVARVGCVAGGVVGVLICGRQWIVGGR